ncbi:MAG TPA: thioredoxin domain-containing protein [Candidatus Nanoarchaeia archaeon]|nr:thioredoxin domain-containing protein [Candidatus Nanoarchaeia archaeon]
MKKIVVGILMVLSVLVIGCSSNNQTGDNDALAKCLTEKGAVMYGTEWCSHCKTQKEYFGSSFKYVDYVDCDRNRDRCTAADVKGYPTWQINGNNYPGAQPLERLASLAGCQGNLTG